MRKMWLRRVIPRWRSSTISAALPANLPVRSYARDQAGDSFLEHTKAKLIENIDEWRADPTVGVAADLLNLGHVPELQSLLFEPADFLSNRRSEISVPLFEMAERIKGACVSRPRTCDPHQNWVHREISHLKKRLVQNPRDAIAYVDIARFYAAQGQNFQAERAIRTAVALLPDNRFVLRSASRFYIHDDNPEVALAILKRSARTRTDPWLMASTIAIETILGKSSQQFKRAAELIEARRFSPVHLAELAAALATVHANDGSMKNARRMFNSSLFDPNDNAVAQAIWAANEFSMSINVDPKWLEGDFSHEANYYKHESLGDYEGSLNDALKWFDDEPFSTRPLQAAAFAAAVLGKYNLAESQARQALRRDPMSLDVKKNLVFALAGQEKLEEAIGLQNEICVEEIKNDKEVSGHSLANIGLLYYRTKEWEKGRQFYNHAADYFAAKKQMPSQAIALSFWAKEALLANDPDKDTILERALKAAKTAACPSAKFVLRRLAEDSFNEVSSEKRIVNSAVTWTHDSSNNVLIIDKKKPFRF